MTPPASCHDAAPAGRSAVADDVPVIAVVGNPNVGKSSLFNALTGLRQRVGNYAGVTVEALEGTVALPGEARASLVDLPGTYSLVPNAQDEAIVERALSGRDQPAPDLVLVVCDATNLRRNLFLLSEVLDLGRPVVVALNMVDEARRGGVSPPTSALAERLGVPVVETVATTGEGLDALRAAIARALAVAPPPSPRAWHLPDAAQEAKLAAVAPGSVWSRVTALRATDPAVRQAEVGARYAWINEALGATSRSPNLRARSDRFDAVLLHPVAGPVAFLAVMGVVFQAVFAGAEPIMKLIEAGFAGLAGWTSAALPALIGELGTSLVSDGVIAGVGSVIVFLPQILILFFFLGLLEDTGYMARAAFIVDRPLRAIGLSGRSFIPLLSSFACAIPGVLATRTIPSRRERLVAMFLAPLMTCSARLPVYTLLIAAFVPQRLVLGFLSLQGLVLLGLYLSGLAAAALLALVISRRKAARGRELPIVVELPPYRRPAMRGVLLKLRLRGGDFLRRAGTTIFAVTVVLWALMNFPRPATRPETPEAKAAAVEASYAGKLGHLIEPAIRPLGYDWKMGIGLIASFAAREVFVSTLGIVYSVGDDQDEESQPLRERLQGEVDPATGKPVYSLPVVFSLLVFFVFALQCGSTIAVVRRESGSWPFALGQAGAFLALAWVGAFVTYRVLLVALA